MNEPGTPPRPGGIADHPHIALIHRLYGLLDAEKTQTIRRELLNPDAVWHAAGHHAHATDQKGPDALLSALGKLRKEVPRGEGMLLPVGDDLVLDIHRGWAPKDKARRGRLWVVMFQVRQERIAAIHPFAFDDPAATAFFSLRH